MRCSRMLPGVWGVSEGVILRPEMATSPFVEEVPRRDRDEKSRPSRRAFSRIAPTWLPQRRAEGLCPSAFLIIPQDWGPGGTLSRSPAASRSSPVLQSGGVVVRVAIMQVFRVIRKAVLAFHRWFMKYSGMTMIIDNVEERRRWRENQDRLEEASDSSTERDSPSQE